MRVVRAARVAPSVAARLGPARVPALAPRRLAPAAAARTLSSSAAARRDEAKKDEEAQAGQPAPDGSKGPEPATEQKHPGSTHSAAAGAGSAPAEAPAEAASEAQPARERHIPHYGEFTPDGKPIGPDGQPIVTIRGAWNAAKEEWKLRLAEQNKAAQKLASAAPEGKDKSVSDSDTAAAASTPATATREPGSPSTSSPSSSSSSPSGDNKDSGKDGEKPKDNKQKANANDTKLGALLAGAKKGVWFIFRFGGLLLPLSLFSVLAYKRRQKMIVHPDTWLFWNLHNGSIVETKPEFGLADLLGPVAGELPQPIELFDAVRALNYAAADPRIVGLFADFSNIHNPTGAGGPGLGLAQMEELAAAIVRFKVAKKQQFGSEARVAIVWSDTFNTQSDYALAASFDEVYMQRSGNVPLTGLAGQIPFAQKLLGWFGIKMRARARKDYKSMVATFTQDESLTGPQADNQALVMGELTRALCSVIGTSRWPELGHEGSTDHVVKLAKDGPFFGQEALDAGLVTDLKLKSDLLSSLFGLDAKGELPPRPSDRDQTPVKWHQRRRGAPAFMSVPTYADSNDKALKKRLSDDEQFKVGMVMADSSISSIAATKIIRGLNEAADDEEVNAIVLRIDSPGGDVIASEDIWDAVRRVNAKKPVIASFGNTAASGGYYIATAAELITAGQGTLTGSIGVASLSPQISRSFFDRIGVYLQTFFTGSTNMSAVSDISPEFEKRMEKSMDLMYDDFLGKVASGRGMAKEAVDTIAGGRVWTGLQAYLVANKDVEAYWNPKTGVLLIGDPPVDDASAATPEAKKIRLGDLLSAYDAVTHPAGAETGNPFTLVERKEGGASGVLEDAWRAGLPSEAYGRGLVDAVGGLYDAAALAWQMGLQRQVADKVAEGLSEEEAQLSIRPTAPRAIVDGQLVLQGDLSAKKFPAEKGFLARLRAPEPGERPRLSGSPVGEPQSPLVAIATNPLGTWEAAKAHLASMMARASLQALASSAQGVSLAEVVRAANNPVLTASHQPRMVYGGYDTLSYQ